MTERERWIVYPLLFLALGAAMRDKIFNLTRSQKVVCEGLAVYQNGDPQHPVAILGAERLTGVRANDMLRVDQVRTRRLDVDQLVYRGQQVDLGAGVASTVVLQQVLQWMKANGLLREQPPGAIPGPKQPTGETPKK